MKKLLLFLIFVNNFMYCYSTTYYPLSSDITTNTTLSINNSPYEVTVSISVYNGATLTIDPNVTVTFDPGCSLSIGDASYPNPNGTLYAVGTSSQYITFDQNSSGWSGIIFTQYAIPPQTPTTNTMQYCTITDVIGAPAITFNNVNTNIIIDNCTINYNSNTSLSNGSDITAGIYCYNSSNPPNPSTSNLIRISNNLEKTLCLTIAKSSSLTM